MEATGESSSREESFDDVDFLLPELQSREDHVFEDLLQTVLPLSGALDVAVRSDGSSHGLSLLSGHLLLLTPPHVNLCPHQDDWASPLGVALDLWHPRVTHAGK